METIGTITVVCLVVVGLTALVAGSLYLSLSLFGRIIKMIGIWDASVRALVIVYREKRLKKGKL